jgi:hypothetical protein
MQQNAYRPQAAIIIYVAAQRKSCNAAYPRSEPMAKRSVLSRVGGMFATFGSAVAVANALEAGRRPKAYDVANLGIEPQAFEAIRTRRW